MIFHSGCHKFPRKVTHPYHLHHPLTFTFRNYETGVISDGNIDESFWNRVLSEASTYESNTSDPKKFGSVQASRSQSNTAFDKCTWCGEKIQGNWFYRCSICNFCLDLSCFQNSLLLNVANPKSHHHSLVFYPRPLLTPCDACGLVNILEPSYACFQCNYMVHRSCIDLPRVIKITRHQHRLFHTPYLQPITSPCLVCYKTLDVKYGLYSCNHEDCSYVVHSKCATHENVWDGKELEWEPEEPDETEDIPPFTKVGTDLIKHFSHKHLLKLDKYDGGRDAEKQCQACILPVNSHNFYNCIQCNFSLQKVCAGLLRKMDHALHIHPLVLDPSPWENREHVGCSVCSRKSTGFRYICVKENCGFVDKFRNRFQMDVRCVLVPDYFTHKSHEHPLFISTSYKGKEKICCKVCKEMCQQSYLQCSECKFAVLSMRYHSK